VCRLSGGNQDCRSNNLIENFDVLTEQGESADLVLRAKLPLTQQPLRGSVRRLGGGCLGRELCSYFRSAPSDRTMRLDIYST